MTKPRGAGRQNDGETGRLLAAAGAALRRGAFAEAESLAQRVLGVDADHPEALSLLGSVALAGGRAANAIALFEKAIRRAPALPMLRCNLAFSYRLSGRLEDAVREARDATRLDPKLTPAQTILGTALKELGRADEAIEPLTKALELQPGLPPAVLALGGALHLVGRSDEARQRYESAVAANPKFADAWSALGWIHVEARRYEEAARCFHAALVARRASPWWPGDGVAPVPPSSGALANLLKVDHDIEQLSFLLDRDLLPAQFAETIAGYRRVRDKIAGAHGADANLILSPAELGPIAPAFARTVHWRATPAHDETVLGGWDRSEVEARYANPPGLCWVDGLLSDRALEDLRRFCLESTIWNDLTHNFHSGAKARAYLGTYAADGFSCPLLFQIAEELTQAMPAVFKDHRLLQMWAYKYAANAEGIDFHGDDAAVNVNFWITPDDANLNPDSGGLVVYPVRAPAEWNFAEINKDSNRISTFLAESGVAPVNVPYRRNRAVIFNSDLFHATAPLQFKPGYEQRRINVTMLFGRRER